MRLILNLVFLTLPIVISGQYTGATPWENCFGKNVDCKLYVKDGYYVGCSNIKVNTSSSSAVVVVIKQKGRVLKHAYISANNTHDIEVPDGTNQVFFYYGDNWDSNKKINSNECNSVYGGFLKNEFVGKDDPISLDGQIMTYTLTRVTYGNFTQKSSSLDEAL